MSAEDGDELCWERLEGAKFSDDDRRREVNKVARKVCVDEIEEETKGFAGGKQGIFCL